jgi:hypothetical protein
MENTLILKQCNAMRTTNSAHTQLEESTGMLQSEQAGRQCAGVSQSTEWTKEKGGEVEQPAVW